MIALAMLFVAAQAVGAPTPSNMKFVEAPAGMTYHGGAYDGLTVGYQRKDWLTLLPSKIPANPVPERLQAAVAAFIAGEEQRRPELYASYVEPDALAYTGCILSCAPTGKFMALGFPFKETCKGNAPSYMSSDRGELEAVRIEWICKDELWYLTFLSIDGDKISGVASIRSDPPKIMQGTK